MSSLILATAASRPDLLVLVIWRYSGGFYGRLEQSSVENIVLLTPAVAMVLLG